MGKIQKFYILLLLIGSPFVSRASGYWLDIKGSGKLNEPVQIQVCYGVIDEFSIRHRETGPELNLAGEFKISIVGEKGERTAIVIHPKADCWEGTFIPRENGVYQILGINNTHPVVDRSKTGGKNVLPIDYLCTAYAVESKGTVSTPMQFLDIIAGRKGEMVTLKIFNKGAPVSNTTKLRVFNPENWEKELSVDEHGETFFVPTMKGLYVIRQDWVDPTPGSYQGTSYTSIRHRCNYCLLVQ